MENSKDLEKLNLISKVLKDNNLSAVEIYNGDIKYRVEKYLDNSEDIDNKGYTKTNLLKDLTSPMTGVFYSSISPESKAFVKEGQKFNKGDVLCILESMKTFTEIKAEESGIIKEICVKNGDIIEYSQVILKYMPI